MRQAEGVTDLVQGDRTERDRVRSRVRARDRLVNDSDVRLFATPDRQRPADRHTRAVGQQ